jgi:hypothetical protein
MEKRPKTSMEEDLRNLTYFDGNTTSIKSKSINSVEDSPQQQA